MVKKLKSKTSKPSSRIFVVEDHKAFREGLVRLLNGETDFVVCGEAASAEKALEAIKQSKPDLALVDLGLTGKSGLELIKEIRALKLAVKLLVVSMYDEALYADRVLRAGGDGYIMKQQNPEDIIEAIRDVLNGHIYVSEEIFAKTSKTAAPSDSKPESRRLDLLSDLELNIMELIGQRKKNMEIARQLQLDEKKIAAHFGQIRKKLRLKSDAALITYAVSWVQTCAA